MTVPFDITAGDPASPVVLHVPHASRSLPEWALSSLLISSSTLDEELDHLAPQLSVILESVVSINEATAEDIPPTSHPIPVTNVFRDDVVTPCLTPEQALSGAPAVEEQRFAVPRILGDEQ